MRELTHDDVLKLLPDRHPEAHKGTFGKVLLLCGSRGYTGAAALAAMGALRTGSGLVYLGVPESIYMIEAVKLTEAIVFPLPDDNGMMATSSVEIICKMLGRMNAVLMGPGMGQSDGARAVLETVMHNAACPVVVDADGINILSMHKDILRGRTAPTVLTPHEGEFQRLAGPINDSRERAASNFAAEWNAIVVLKGHHTVITDGTHHLRNVTGNPGMAVGGSGDVLAGMITSLIGQGLTPLDASACGAWLHGAAGDICAAEIGQYGMLPTDMLEVLPRLMK